MKKIITRSCVKIVAMSAFVLSMFCLCTALTWAGAWGLTEAKALAEVDSAPQRKFSVKLLADSNNEVLAFVFNKPVLAEPKKGFPDKGFPLTLKAAELPFKIEPSLEGQGTWQNPSTLLFNAKGLQPGQRYRITLPDDFTSVYGERLKEYEIIAYSDARWSPKLHGRFEGRPGAGFVLETIWRPLAVQRLEQTRFDLDSRAEFVLRLNLPVKDADLQKELSIGPKGNEAARIPFEILRNVNGEATLRLKSAPGAELTFFLPQSLRAASSSDILGVPLMSHWSSTRKVSNLFPTPQLHTNIEYSYPWKKRVNVYVRQNPRMNGIKEFIKVEPKIAFSVEPTANGFAVLGDFVTKIPYQITLLKGLSGDRGVLTEDYSKVIQFDERGVRLAFTGQGKQLSPALPLLTRLSSKGVEEVKLRAWRVYENNIPTLVTVNSDNSEEGYQTTFSKPLAESRAKIGASDKVEERAIDLGQMLDSKPGAYFLRAEAFAEKGDYVAATASQLVVISDLGLAYKRNRNEITAWVNSIASGQPVEGAAITLYSRANQVVLKGQTGADGIFHAVIADFGLEPNQANQAEQLDAYGYILTASKGEDFNYIGLARNKLEESGLNDSGRQFLEKGYEALCFTPRGIYKPGEIVNVKAIVRDAKMLPPAQNFPLLWSVRGPDGRILGRGTAGFSAQGGLDFTQELPFSARTGKHLVSLFVPGGADTPLGSCSFTVEDFVPPRLDIKLAFSQERYVGNDKVSAEAEVKYLFGGSGAGLPYEAALRLDKAEFKHPDWTDYSFAEDNLAFDPIVERTFAKGKLDEAGRAQVFYQPTFNKNTPQALRLSLAFKAMEDGGRWNGNSASVMLYPKSVLLGINLPETQANKPFKVALAAVTPDGKAAPTTKLKGALFQVQEYYYSMRNDGYSRDGKTEELLPLGEFEVTLKNGLGTAEVKPGSSGPYLLKFSDPVSGASVSKRFYAYSGENGETGGNTALNKISLSFDKPAYRVGDTARVKISAPFAGRLIFTVDNTAEVFRTSLDIHKPEGEVSFKVTENFKPGAFCTAWLARPVEAGKEWAPHRALGVARLNIDYSNSRLNVAFELPERLTPANKQPLKIKLTEATGKPVKGEISVVLVDEGVLGLTRYKTPNPFDFFTAKRGLRHSLYDVYDLLMPLESASTPLLKPGGDSAANESGLFSPFKRKQEILSLFIARIESNEQGEAEAMLDIPEYSGTGRLMIIAHAADKFGSAEKSLPISRDLVLEPTLPLAIAPGDVFEIPVRLFASPYVKTTAEGKAIKVKVSLVAEGPLSLLAEGQLSPTAKGTLIPVTEGQLNLVSTVQNQTELPPGKSASLLFKAVAKPSADSNADQVGVGRITFTTTPEKGPSFSQTLEVVVRPPFPRIVRSESGTLTSADSELQLNTAGLLPGTEQASISIAGNLGVNVMRAASFLNDYPYGCLEQTTSTAWPFLAVPEMLAVLNPDIDMKEQGKRGLEKAFVRLASMRNREGSFNYWPSDSDSSNTAYHWGSIYAAHFLSEAEATGEIKPPEELKNGAVRWLRDFLSYNPSSGEDLSYYLSSKAYACYVLALNDDYPLGWMEYLKSNQDKLYESGRIFLAGAYALHAGNAKPLRQLSLENVAQPAGGRLSTLESSVRNEALKLMLWNALEPSSKEAAGLARSLAKSGADNRWLTTQENAMSLFALSTYVNKTSSGKPFTLTLSTSDGKELLQATEKQSASIGVAQLNQEFWHGKGGIKGRPFKVSMTDGGTDKGTAYYNWTVSGVPLGKPEPVANNMILQRSWVMPDGRIVPLNNAKDMITALTVTQGDKIVIRLTVTPKSGETLKDLVVLDLLPGGCEIENARLLGTQENGENGENGSDTEASSENSNYGSPRLEQREDRLVIIDPWVTGQKTYTYSVRAVTRGEFVIPPTSADLMYDPETKAVLGTGSLIVK